MTTGQRIKARRIEMGYTVDQLAEILGKNRATVYRYESGDIDDMPTKVLESVAKALRTTPARLMGWSDDADYSWLKNRDDIHSIDTASFQVIGEIACGEPIVMNEEHEVYVDASARIKADAILVASGDSMIGARIYDGDIVFIKFQTEVENGEIAAVAINDEATLKRFYKFGDSIVLRAENPNYKDIIIDASSADTIRLIGKAVAFQSDLI
jgi:repressor LexA